MTTLVDWERRSEVREAERDAARDEVRHLHMLLAEVATSAADVIGRHTADHDRLCECDDCIARRQFYELAACYEPDVER